MIRKAHPVFAAAASVVLFAACSITDGEQAQAVTGDEADEATQTVRYADENRDGKVTRDEAGADQALSANFERYDANDNGELDRAEFARLEAQSAERREQAERQERHQLRPRNEYPRDLD